MKEKTKHFLLYLIPLSYGIDVVAANIFGVIIGSGYSTPSMSPDFMIEWNNFVYNAPKIFHLSETLSYILPTLLCVLYARASKEKFEKRFINLPFAFSAIGITGWFVYFIEQLICIVYAKKIGFSFEVGQILLVIIMKTLLSAISTFTFSYFILEALHRAIILPLYYPNGQISKIKGIAKLPIGFFFLSNYLSVTIFPIAFLLVLYVLAKERFSIPVESKTLIVFVMIIVMGLVISIFFEKQFQMPLEKLKRRIKKLNDGDLESKVDIVRNDILGEIADSFNDMTTSIMEKTQRIQAVQNSVIQGMAIMVESRDNSTGGHIKRTSDCVKVFVNQLKSTSPYNNLPSSFFENVIKAAPMHDLGKIAVDDAVLRKPGKFTTEEYEMMKTHSKEGARIVENVLSDIDDLKFKQIAVNVAHFHHEKWDGSGYPEKISAEQIPLEARIMALADVYDALVSKRCYKEEFSYDKAFTIIQESLGSHFDPELGKLFLECRKQLEDLYSN